ncbi:Putative transcriptional regulator [Corynebacterium camporealensis]|uniref:Putative transcriptional regulator n=2 Tax=Corynebacterium camporealensis TaxID=161896 RepID=A0A0F6QW41_9CORY|nr:putative transcriptional regulator [Corynebacterium camporealensis]AVH88406.1 Putative transcriptional regulator [Corynebacterium camporealensis]
MTTSRTNARVHQRGSDRDPSHAKETRTTEGDTRRQIMLMLLKDGPVTASAVAERLGLSAAGIRRHLDILLEEGLTEIVQRRRVGPNGASAGRGRPAKHFRLTDRGRAHFGHAYDELAAEALQALREAGGSEAVKHFAKARFERLVADVKPLAQEGESPEKVARKLAEVLDEHGYAATVSNAGGGVQICQHHCPIAHVAEEHPELCEAEQEVFSALLGKHVQPLASIASGHGICTTNIPLTAVEASIATDHTNTERSGS